MASSEIEICNLALLRVGVTTPIATLADGTKESNACNVLYASHRDLLIGAYWWAFATRRDVLVASDEEARTGWSYVYDLPDDVIGARFIWPGRRRVRSDQRIPFAVEAAADGEGRVLLTDHAEPELISSGRITRVANFSPFFADALASLIASELVVPLALAPTLVDGAMKRFQISFANGIAADADQHQEDPLPRDAFTAARSGRLAIAPYDVPVVSEGG